MSLTSRLSVAKTWLAPPDNSWQIATFISVLKFVSLFISTFFFTVILKVKECFQFGLMTFSSLMTFHTIGIRTAASKVIFRLHKVMLKPSKVLTRSSHLAFRSMKFLARSRHFPSKDGKRVSNPSSRMPEGL